MNAEFYEKAREKYRHIIDGRAGRWFDPGEYEYLILEYFKELVPTLLQGSAEEAQKFLSPPPGSDEDARKLQTIATALKKVRMEMGFDDDEHIRGDVEKATQAVLDLSRRLNVHVEV